MNEPEKVGRKDREAVRPGAFLQQRLVDKHFESATAYWHNVYSGRSLDSMIYTDRQEEALRLAAQLELDPGSNVLEIGCGGGLLTLRLAGRGYNVTAVDRVRASLDLVRERAARSGLRKRITASVGDVHSLDYRDGMFDLVFALGVIPWLHSPEIALNEIVRVLKPGGHAVITVDNRLRLNYLLDPRFNPLVAPAREVIRRWLERLGLRTASVRPSFPVMHSPGEFDLLLKCSGLKKSASLTVGFGPFTFLGKRVLPDGLGKIFCRALQALAGLRLPALRSTGSHYIVLVEKPALLRAPVVRRAVFA
jgi:ubiquinone/menaquinone biosynthesis C-methylase UbiE